MVQTNQILTTFTDLQLTVYGVDQRGGGDDVAIQTNFKMDTHTQNHDEDTKKYYTSKERDIFIK